MRQKKILQKISQVPFDEEKDGTLAFALEGGHQVPRVAKVADYTGHSIQEHLTKTLQKNKGDNKILRLVLKGSPSLDFQLDKEILEKEFSSDYFYLKIDDRIHIPENLQEDETIRGQFIKLIKQELKKEKDDAKKKILENALRVGIGHLDKKL